jgi:hypothetical protein
MLQLEIEDVEDEVTTMLQGERRPMTAYQTLEGGNTPNNNERVILNVPS